jgi:hypothetical protein
MAIVLGFSVIMAVPASSNDTKIVMHVVPAQEYMHCYVPEELGYRDPALDTVTEVTPGEDVYVFVYLYDYDVALGSGFQLVWPADWEFRGWTGPCLAHQVTLFDDGPTYLHVGTAFDEMSGGALMPLGYARFLAGESGEVALAPSGIMCGELGICLVTVDETGGVIEVAIEQEATGRVAIGGGYNPAGPLPVRPSTWGAIKSQYQ